jgi:hypothetical protein
LKLDLGNKTVTISFWHTLKSKVAESVAICPTRVKLEGKIGAGFNGIPIECLVAYLMARGVLQFAVWSGSKAGRVLWLRPAPIKAKSLNAITSKQRTLFALAQNFRLVSTSRVSLTASEISRPRNNLAQNFSN